MLLGGHHIGNPGLMQASQVRFNSGINIMDTSLLNDLSSYWMPMTANRQFKKAPRMVVAAEGMYYTTADGRSLLDGTAGLWCVNAGHSRPEITAAIAEQAHGLGMGQIDGDDVADNDGANGKKPD